MKAHGTLALAFFLAPSLVAQSQATAPLNQTLSKEEMKADIVFLASENLRGRLTGTPEMAIVTDFVGSRFERLGLKPVGPGGSYYQPFNLLAVTLGPGSQIETSPVGTVAAASFRFFPGQDYYPLRFSANAVARGPLVFVGFGIRPADYGPAVRGKIALALDHEPGENDPASPFDGVVSSVASSQINKTLLAQRQGAIGILFVQDVHNHPLNGDFDGAYRSYWPSEPPRIERWELADWVDKVSIPAAQISPALADKLAQGSGRSLIELAGSVDGPSPARPIELRDQILALTANLVRRTTTVRNVVALLEGSDPELKDEWVVITAHPDHNGAEPTQIFYGADDNASGVAGMIAIAEAYARAAKQGTRPPRSILFAAFDGEERSPASLGAWAYLEHPLNALEKTVAVINFDLIARNEEVPEGGGSKFRGLPVQTAESNQNSINILGLSRAPWLRAEIDRANRPFGLTIKADYDNNISQLLRRSDHWPFINRGVPGLWFLTGLHPDYHTSGDRPERLNYEKMERIVRMAHQLSWNLAQSGRPR